MTPPEPPDPSWRDAAYLLDMLLAARRVREFTRDVTWEVFEHSDLIQNATMHAIQIIGEAARKVSEGTRRAHPQLPWLEIIGMRYRLVHDYFRIDARKVWDTAARDIPALMSVLEPLVPPDSDSG